MKALACVAVALTPLALAGCSQEGPGERPAVAPAATALGEPQSCIQLSQVSETRIRDDWTIDFIGGGGRAWRNTLTSRCPGLKAENAITYETSLSQLCNTDIVYVLRTTPSPQRRPACGLGQFVPVKLGNR